MIVLVMGVSGSGKSLVGRQLATELGWRFFDADDFHPPSNIAKMKEGEPLMDADREPWLHALRFRIDACIAGGQSAVFAVSALKQAYRQTLLEGHDGIRLVYLKGSYNLIRRRLEARTHHFFDPALLQSQFDVLEEPDEAIIVAVDQPLNVLVRCIRECLCS
jgi:gluconokinase